MENNSRNVAYKSIHELYSRGLNQVEAFQFANRFFGLTAFGLAFMTDKPALWIGLGIAVADAIYNEVRLSNVDRDLNSTYHRAKNSVMQALQDEKNR